MYAIYLMFFIHIIIFSSVNVINKDITLKLKLNISINSKDL